MMDGSHDKLHEYYVLVESVKYGSGYRDFCISQNNIITINNYYYCSDIDIEYKNQYKYKISDIGTFVFTK